MKNLWYEGTAQDWEAALLHYWDLIPQKKLPLEREMASLRANTVEAMDGKSFYRFLYECYFPWKYTASNRLATTRAKLEQHLDDLPGLARIHDALFLAPENDISWGLRTAKQIRGLGVAGASGLLAILFPQFFGTVDQFVVKSLLVVCREPWKERLEHMNPQCLTIKDGTFLIEVLRKKAAELNGSFRTNTWTPRAVDMVLWAYQRAR